MQHDHTVTPHGQSVLTSRGLALATLILANLGALYFFIRYDGSMLQVLWIYWLQSVIIGAVHVARIRTLNFSLKDVMTVNGQPLSDEQAHGMQRFGRAIVSVIFSIHYGGVHFVFMLFLLAFGSGAGFRVNGESVGAVDLGVTSGSAVLLSGLIFAVHHILSFIGERQMRHGVTETVTTFGDIMVRPYHRIIPMHIIIILAPIIASYAGNVWLFAVFMALKTVADVMLFRRGISHRLGSPRPVTTHIA